VGGGWLSCYVPFVPEFPAPTSGPGPAMAAKWCPNRIHRLVGSKSWPSRGRSAGVARRSFSASTRTAMNLP